MTLIASVWEKSVSTAGQIFTFTWSPFTKIPFSVIPWCPLLNPQTHFRRSPFPKSFVSLRESRLVMDFSFPQISSFLLFVLVGFFHHGNSLVFAVSGSEFCTRGRLRSPPLSCSRSPSRTWLRENENHFYVDDLSRGRSGHLLMTWPAVEAGTYWHVDLRWYSLRCVDVGNTS